MAEPENGKSKDYAETAVDIKPNATYNDYSMDARKFAARFSADIKAVRASGQATIECEKLLAYIDDKMSSLETEPSVAQIEQERAALQSSIEEQRLRHEENLETFRAAISFGQGAIKSLFLANAGAVVVMLAFISHLTEAKSAKVPEFAYSVMPFAIGVFVAAMIGPLAYLSQSLYRFGKYDLGHWTRYFCIFLAFISLVFFMWGLVVTYYSFLNFNT